MADLPIVLAITGASGAPYSLKLLQSLAKLDTKVWLIVSSHGWRLLETECGISDLQSLRGYVGSDTFDRTISVFDDKDRGALPASGSARTQGMVVCPCSMGTLSAIAHGSSRSLVERSADVTLKERRRLVLVTRETPLSLIHIENMAGVTRAGAVVMPASPGFYHKPKEISELTDFMVARVLDHFGFEHTTGLRWTGETK